MAIGIERVLFVSNSKYVVSFNKFHAGKVFVRCFNRCDSLCCVIFELN